MNRSGCAAAVFGAALVMGAALGAMFVFVNVLTSLRSIPSARPDIDSWIGSLGVSAITGLGGGIAGALIGAAACSMAALTLVLVDLRPQALLVRACAVGVGSAVGAALVLWFLASRPGMLIGVDFIAVLSALAAGLAVGALLLSERSARHSVTQTPA